MVDAAEEMPAEKYGYRPTPEQWMFGNIISHVADANNRVCAMFSDTPAAAWGEGERDSFEGDSGGGAEGVV